MEFIHYRDKEAYFEEVSLKKIAEDFGTPCYVYSRQVLEENYCAFAHALYNPPKQSLVCYAVKANSNLTLLNLLGHLGAGFDIVSEGELERVLVAAGDPQKIVFSGVGKTRAAIKRALAAKILCFNIESESELERIQTLAAEQHTQASIALRINPNIDAQTHPYISTGLKNNKFGIELEALPSLLLKIKKMSTLRLQGLACHIGSQLLALDPFLQVMECLRKVYLECLKIDLPIQHINMGGGLGVRYHNETPPSPQHYISAVRKVFDAYPVNIIVEPGRAIVANAGILLTRVEYLKSTSLKNFAIVDAAMNDLMRPALYDAWQDIIPVTLHPEAAAQTYDIVGPICESADFLGKNRLLRLEPGTLLAILTSGAYGFCMSSNYNSRPRAAEILIDKDRAQLIRRRETIPEIFGAEQ
jgi:diaminopimelate decarboxylase